jgi:predicted transcriptional regulator of viral defense system
VDTALAGLPDTFTVAQATAAGVTKTTLYRLRDQGHVEAVARGVYRRAAAPMDTNVELVELALRVPSATLCLETALARHDLSDALIAAPDIAVPRGTRPPVLVWPVRWHFFQTATFEVERNQLALEESVSIGLYSAERSIVDAFRLRGREGRDVANEALRRWLRRRGAEPSKLLAIAAQLPRTLSPLRHALEVLL